MGQKRRPGGGFGALSRGRWLSRHGAGCLSCLVTSICVVDPSRRSVLRSHGKAMSCQISSTQVVDPSHGSVLRSHRRAMSRQISSIFSTRLVDPSRTPVVRSHSKVMHDPCRPPQQVSAYAPPPAFAHAPEALAARADLGASRARAFACAASRARRPLRTEQHARIHSGAGSVDRHTGMTTARHPQRRRDHPSRPGPIRGRFTFQEPPEPASALPAIQTPRMQGGKG